MDARAPGASEQIPEDEETYCYAHPKTPTKLRCSRCERPICGRCAIPASVGQHCPECVAEARRSAPKVRTALRAGAPAVFFILALNVGMFIAQQVFTGRGGGFDLTARLWLFPPAIAIGDEWWRLLTPMVLHGPVWHILVNSYALFAFGPNVEEAFGTFRFVVLYVIAGFVGNAASYAFGDCFTPSVGASGAIFGLLGALIIFAYNRRTSQFMGALLQQLLLVLGLNLLLGFTIPRINNLAHIGGLIGGASIGWVFDQRRIDRQTPAFQIAAVAAMAAAGIALVLWRTSTFTCASPFS